MARPTFTPRATENIDGMIRLVEELLEKQLAYAAGGDIFYAVERFPGYGKLSGRNLEDMLAGARIDVNETKRNPLDFVLWKASKEGEPWWESPWGRRPAGLAPGVFRDEPPFLGETLDIHGGGRGPDLPAP